MSTASWLAFNAFFSRLPDEKRERLGRFLSPSLSEKVSALPPTLGDPTYGIPTEKDFISEMHYSWIISLLENFSESDQIVLISPLDKPKQDKIRMRLKLGERSLELSKQGQQFIIQRLINWIIKEIKNYLPKPLLPEDPLNQLLDFDKPKLLKLLDYLGLYDLAFDLKKVIESSKLKTIQEILKKDEILFLKKAMKAKDRLQVASLGISHWDGDEKKLRNMLQSRGINRLAKALFYSHSALRLHLMFKLDTSRANVLKKYCSETHDEEARKILINQVLSLLEEFEKNK